MLKWEKDINGYDTAEEAMAAAEFEVAAKEIEIDWEDLEPLDLEDLEDAYWDAVAHERMEIARACAKQARHFERRNNYV